MHLALYDHALLYKNTCHFGFGTNNKELCYINYNSSIIYVSLDCLSFLHRRNQAEILPILRKTPINQSIFTYDVFRKARFETYLLFTKEMQLQLVFWKFQLWVLIITLRNQKGYPYLRYIHDFHISLCKSNSLRGV